MLSAEAPLAVETEARTTKGPFIDDAAAEITLNDGATLRLHASYPERRMRVTLLSGFASISSSAPSSTGHASSARSAGTAVAAHRYRCADALLLLLGCSALPIIPVEKAGDKRLRTGLLFVGGAAAPGSALDWGNSRRLTR